MFEAFRKIMSELVDGGKPPARYDARDFRLAAAALLVHAASIDGSIAEVERERLHGVIKQHFKLDDEGTDELIAQATVADENAVDLYRFTTQLNRTLDGVERARIVEMMWQVVYADGVVTEFEDNLIWRAADLLHVSREERIALKGQVAAQYDNRDQSAS
ncbi:MAG: TerB family tellurite resistance protein [Rhodopseudomonas sp.]|nr:TerB family tellurite resistance protein [Rhodopseudomonas sp.]